MRIAVVAVMTLAIAGCGRFAFDPREDANGGSGSGSGSDAAGPSDLVLDFAFESDGILLDGAGAHDGTCTSCPTSTGGVHAGSLAAHFDGTNCIHVAAATADLKPAAFTFAAWERTPQMRQQTIFGHPFQSATGTSDTFELYNPGTVTSVYVTVPGSTIEVSTGLNQWHHVAGVFDGTSLSAYVDGVASPFVQPVPAAVYENDDILIGCDIDSGVERANLIGDVDDARLYNRALSTSEIAALAVP